MKESGNISVVTLTLLALVWIFRKKDMFRKQATVQ